MRSDTSDLSDTVVDDQLTPPHLRVHLLLPPDLLSLLPKSRGSRRSPTRLRRSNRSKQQRHRLRFLLRLRFLRRHQQRKQFWRRRHLRLLRLRQQSATCRAFLIGCAFVAFGQAPPVGSIAGPHQNTRIQILDTLQGLGRRSALP